MAICRIYLATYRRHDTLPRAIESLLKQTVTDWVCEVHNDDPEDLFPRQFVEKLADPRIQIVDHPENLGATRTFNLVFQPTSEAFVSLLEDDNWWEPDFLETMIDTMQRFPTIQVGWTNMRCWIETADGRWTDTGKNVWDVPANHQVQLFDWGHPRQIFTALHSNGAMMVRSQTAPRYVVPDNTPFECVEAGRERTFQFPILFVPKVCANYALATRSSARSDSRITWAQLQTLFAASFLKYVPFSGEALQQVWQSARQKIAKSTSTLFFAAFICPENLSVLKHATLSDWLFFIGYCLKHPIMAWQVFRAIATYPELWKFLDEQTAMRSRERVGGC